jgi:hypothetical protein
MLFYDDVDPSPAPIKNMPNIIIEMNRNIFNGELS